MHTDEITETEVREHEELKIQEKDFPFLKSIVQWSKFLSIVGFVFLALSAIGIISVGLLITGVNEYAHMTHMYPYAPGVFSWMYVVVIIIIDVIYFFPIYFLYKFSGNLKNALAQRNIQSLSDAIKFLQKHYMLIGILTIVALVFMMMAFFMVIIAILSMM